MTKRILALAFLGMIVLLMPSLSAGQVLAQTPTETATSTSLAMLAQGYSDALLIVLVVMTLVIVAAIVVMLRLRAPSAGVYLESASNPGVRFRINRGSASVGRASDCQIRIDDKLDGFDTVSHYHARLLLNQSNSRWMALDGSRDGVPSQNGVYVNDGRTRENYLKDGDRVRFGMVEFVFRLPTTPPQAKKGASR